MKESMQFSLALVLAAGGVAMPFMLQREHVRGVVVGFEDPQYQARWPDIGVPPESLSDADNTIIAKAARGLLYRCQFRRAMDDCQHRKESDCDGAVSKQMETDKKYFAFMDMAGGSALAARNAAVFQLKMCLEGEREVTK